MSQPAIAIQFLGAAGTVTGSKFAVHVDGRTTLVDCGLFQGLEELRVRNWEPLPIEPGSIREILLTHAHVDHSGYLPRLTRQGYRGDVIATHATKDLLRILLLDSGHLHEEEARYRNEAGATRYRPALPLYTADDGADAAARVTGVDWEQRLPLGEHTMATFHRAGHILGAASVHLEVRGAMDIRRLVFSGEVGRYDAPIVPDSAPLGDVDYVGRGHAHRRAHRGRAGKLSDGRADDRGSLDSGGEGADDPHSEGAGHYPPPLRHRR
jgi:metallo-beta-lactamase family protein